MAASPTSPLTSQVPRPVFGLRPQIMLIILGICVVGIVLTFLGFRGVINRITVHLGAAYAGRYALSNRALLQEPLTREIALARQMADSPTIRDWIRHERNTQRRSTAMAVMETYRKRLAEGAWFCVVHSSLNYYYDDASDRYGETAYAYTLRTNLASDAWYFATLAQVPEYALNINYDRALDTRKVWINAVMRETNGTPLGIIGTGLDLTKFLSAFVDQTEPGVENIILDSRLAIQAHRNRALIDLQSVAKAGDQHSTLEPLLTGSGDFDRLTTALGRLRAGEQTQTFFVTLNGGRRLVGASYLANLDWYMLTALDLDTVIRQQIFRPVLGLALALTLALIGLVAWAIHYIILSPLAAITDAARRLSRGEYNVAGLPVDRRDEIGTLATAFADMSNRIREHTSQLESRVAERTTDLAAANRTLQENMARLQEALANVRTLKGLLPICCSCKKIRNDSGYWSQIESYIRQHTDTEFSHGICPDCMKKLYPDFADDEPDGA